MRFIGLKYEIPYFYWVEKDNIKDEEKELDKALSNEAFAKMENNLTNAELTALAAFFSKEMKKGKDQPLKEE